MPRTPDTIVSLHDVERSYRLHGQVVRALSGVSLDIAAGDSVALVGPSGSGKSTLLHVLSGLDEVQSGTVTVLGKDLAAMSDDARAQFRNRTVGFVFQDFHLLPELDACANVMLPLLLRRPTLARATVRSRALAALAAVGLSARARHRPGELSGGEQQRVAIARAVVSKPAILVADEPTGNLDQKTGHAMIMLLRRLQREEGATLVLATHDEELAAMCDRTVKLIDGRLRA